jgi:outer membrane protein OmpA-like peptidoglycan-associated protein
VTVPGVAPDGCPLRRRTRSDRDGDGFKDPSTPASTTRAPSPTAARTATATASRTTSTSARRSPASRPTAARRPTPTATASSTPNDSCIDEPETKNNYKDADGCPDEVPKAVAKFAGVIKGIYFDVDKDTIKKTSKKTLDAAVKVLKEFDDVKRRDQRPHRQRRQPRAQRRPVARRAESVKKYLVDKGIDRGRLSTRGRRPGRADRRQQHQEGQGAQPPHRVQAGTFGKPACTGTVLIVVLSSPA